MRRWLKVLLAALTALVVLLVLNAVVLNHQTKPAEVRVDGAKILDMDGGDLQVLDRGPRDASPIVLLHCYTCAIDWWGEVIPRLERGGHRVIAIDLLGHGGSEMPGSGYSMQGQAQLVAQALGELDVSGATVVGHSLGGAVATALAEQSPDLVSGVAIVDTEPDTSYGSLDLLARSVYVPVIGEALWRVKMDWTIRKGLEEAFAPGYDVPDQFVDDVKQMTYTAYEDSHSGFDSYVSEAPLDQRLRDLDLPVLVAFGAKDQIVDAREALSAYADIPDARTALIQGSGHSPNVEKPVETTRLIQGFANSNQARDTTAAGAAGSGKGAADGKIVVTCKDLRFDGPGRPDWRKHSAVAGPLGLGGAGRDFQNASLIGGVLEAKLPALVEGQQPVTLKVPESERGHVGLVYGGFHRVRAVSAEAQQVTFVPCQDKPRTVWPGALALADRDRITLEVVVGGSVKKLRIG